MSDCGRTAGATLSVPEDSITFVPTLLLSYPTGTPEMNATQLVSLLPTAEKYGMQRAIWFIKRQWPEFARSHPLSAFLVAAHHNLDRSAGLLNKFLVHAYIRRDPQHIRAGAGNIHCGAILSPTSVP